MQIKYTVHWAYVVINVESLNVRAICSSLQFSNSRTLANRILVQYLYKTIGLLFCALGKVSKRKTPVSCVGVMNYGGCENTVKELLPLADEARANYTRLVQRVAEFLRASGLCSPAGHPVAGADTSKANPLVAEFISKAVAELTEGKQSDVVEASGGALELDECDVDADADADADADDERVAGGRSEEAARRVGEQLQSAIGVTDVPAETAASQSADVGAGAKETATTKPKLKLTIKPIASLEEAARAAAAKSKAPVVPFANLVNKQQQQQQSSRNAVLSAVARSVLPDEVPVAVAEADDPDAIISALIGSEAPAVVPPSSRVPAGFGSLPF